MSEPDAPIVRDIARKADDGSGFDIALGQRVRLATDPSGRAGWVVAVMLTEPYEALVRWREAEATFEALDDLIDLGP